MGPGTIGYILVNLVIAPAFLLALVVLVSALGYRMVKDSIDETRREMAAEAAENEARTAIISQLPSFPELDYPALDTADLTRAA